MPRFPVNFRRRSTAPDDQHGAVTEPSFRVLERAEVASGKSFDGGASLSRVTGVAPRTSVADFPVEDNIFAGLKPNRDSAYSNTTKTASDSSSRHSNGSTAPSSTEYPVPPEDPRFAHKKSALMNETPLPPPPSRSPGPGALLKQAGRTFSFGMNKKNSLPAIPAEEATVPVPSMDSHDPLLPGTRTRAQTTSTTSTATPPKLDDTDLKLDMGSDFSSVLFGFNKRSSVATVKDESGRSVTASRNLIGGRTNQPSPLQIDHSAPVDPPQHSWNSQHSNDDLLGRDRRPFTSPTTGSAPLPRPQPRVPRVNSPPSGRQSDDDEDVLLLKDSLAATRFLSGSASEVTGSSSHRAESASGSRGRLVETYAKPPGLGSKRSDDNLFENSVPKPSKRTSRTGQGSSSQQPKNKVMTPEEFEKYRRDKALQESTETTDRDKSPNDDEDNYEEEDEADEEKTRQLAKQRKKQEAHMTVYRQQMMKVTGESSTGGPAPSRARLSVSMSTPNLLDSAKRLSVSPSPSDGSEDEEVPLAILAAHGFPNKNRPPTRLSHMASSTPNIGAAVAPPGSVAGDGHTQQADNAGGMPAFARKLPKDPYVGAGLVSQPPRESFALGGGNPAPTPPAQPGGLVGVIASEERSRALRRGSPAVDSANHAMPSQMPMPMNGGVDPMASIPPHMMYPPTMGQRPQMPTLTPGDQAQLQMNQQMQQFMQMQMQFMQMMAQNQTQNQAAVRQQGHHHAPSPSMGSLGQMSRNSFLGDPMANGLGGGSGGGGNPDMFRPGSQSRTRSMVQPSSASWIQPPNPAGYAPSIRAQGGGYAPSIAPSERSNIGLPGRYRPVSSVMAVESGPGRSATMTSALRSSPSKANMKSKVTLSAIDDDDDDEQGWAAMKAKREKTKSAWRSKKSFGSELGALIS